MFLVCFRVNMTRYASNLVDVRWIIMAFYALIPDTFMFTTIHWKIHPIVIEGRWFPGILSMTGSTIS